MSLPRQPTFWTSMFRSAKLKLEMEKKKEETAQFQAI